MKVVTTRIEDKYFEDLKRIEKEEKIERAEVMRKLLARAIKEWKIKKALELLKERKVTIRKAASIAELSYVEILDLVSKHDISIGYGVKELKKDLKR
jgi:predicted HTH domain antitoxin